MRQAKVYVRFPRAGLGNMLLTWSRAYVFARLNDIEMHTSSWTAIHLGVFLRGERKSRLYLGYFKEAAIFKKLRFIYYGITKRNTVEPPVEHISKLDRNCLFIFNKIFTDYDFFKEVRDHRKMVKEGILDMLKPQLRKQYHEHQKPVIGIHIRRGDFSRGSFITPLSFFIEVIAGLRKNANSDLQVTVFTDAETAELEEITNLSNVVISESKPDILDLLLLASSETLILSVGSTFSYWAAFLSENTIIKNAAEWHVPFRSLEGTHSGRETTWNNYTSNGHS